MPSSLAATSSQKRVATPAARITESMQNKQQTSNAAPNVAEPVVEEAAPVARRPWMAEFPVSTKSHPVSVSTQVEKVAVALAVAASVEKAEVAAAFDGPAATGAEP